MKTSHKHAVVGDILRNDTVMHSTRIVHPAAGGNKEFLLFLEGALDEFS